MASAHIAIDLGASGGRVMLAALEGEPAVVGLEEAHRFAHEPLDTPTGPVWDLTSLWRETLAGIRAAAALAEKVGAPLRSVGCDTWGVDGALVEPGGEVVGLPHAYRDPAHAAARDGYLARFPGGAAAVYERTGIPPQPFNTLYQLAARHTASPGIFAVPGVTWLQLPDLLHFWLSGARAGERTIASTTGLLAAQSREWDRGLLDEAGLPSGVLSALVEPGTRLGPVRPRLAQSLGLPTGVEVVAPATHDTASAVAAVPAVDDLPGSWAYLSSGTWSLLGVELDRPLTSPAAFAAGFTNELGVGGKTRFLRNIAGLWLVQELRRDLEGQGRAFDYAQLAELAADAEPLRTLVDPNAADLSLPGDSVAKLRGHAARTGQPVPETPGQLARCCFDSLALCYADTIDRIESLTDHRIATLHLVGGGVNNRLLNQLTADATGRVARVGPSEATALGNALVQARGLGLLAGVEEIRAVVARSHAGEVVSPAAASADWAPARRRFQSLIGP